MSKRHCNILRFVGGKTGRTLNKHIKNIHLMAVLVFLRVEHLIRFSRATGHETDTFAMAPA